LTRTQQVFFAGFFILLIILVYLLKPILAPFLMGILFAYLGDPLADKLESLKLSRTMAVVVVFGFFTVMVAIVFAVLIPGIGQQLAVLSQKIPLILQWLQTTALPWLQQLLDLPEDIFKMETIQAIPQEKWTQTSGVFSKMLSGITSTSMVLLNGLLSMALVPVVTFYLLRDWDVLIGKMHRLLPRNIEPVLVQLTKECDEVISAFLRGQFLVMLCLGGIYTLGLWIVGLELALLIGMLAGLASIVPYLGFAVGIVVASVAAIMQFNEMLPLVYVAIVFGIGQMLEGMVLTPLMVGDRIGLHPVAVIFAIMAGGQLFGFVGILLALPVAAVIAVLLRHLHDRYRESDLYSVTDTESGERDS